MMIDFIKLRTRLDQFALELILRAANLDALAAMLDARERELDMREADVLKASEELLVKSGTAQTVA